jgi:alkaline phosphatase D
MLIFMLIGLAGAASKSDVPVVPPPTVEQLRGSRGDVAPLPPADTVIERLAFGSCLSQKKPMPILNKIMEREPRMAVLLGDNVYGDDETGDPSMPTMRAAYGELAQNPHFRRMSASIPVLPTWDDHDFGYNDVGGEFKHKAQAERIFEAFWDVSEDDPRASREGIYTSYTFGEPGKVLQVILLDTRMFRSKLKRMGWGQFWRKGRYVPSSDFQQDVLGRDQWLWLEKALNEPADLRIVVSSFQILPTRSGWEHWGQFPMERAKVLNLLHRRKNVIVVSGDRHWASMYQDDFGLLELTTSSLNRPALPYYPEKDVLQIRKPIIETNFGEVDIDWEERKAAVRVINGEGNVVLKNEFVF